MTDNSERSAGESPTPNPRDIALSIADTLGNGHRLYPSLCRLANEIERIDADAANERAEKESLAAIVRTRDEEIERLTRENEVWRREVTGTIGDNEVLYASREKLRAALNGIRRLPSDVNDELWRSMALNLVGEALSESGAPRREAGDRAGPKVSRHLPESQCDAVGGCPELRDTTTVLNKAREVIANAYQAVGCLVLPETDKRPSEADETRLLDMLSRWEDWTAARVSEFLPWPTEWEERPSRSIQRRIAAQRGEPAPEFGAPTGDEHGK